MQYSDQNIADYKAAVAALETAKGLFDKITQEECRDYDAAHFASQVAHILMHDHGECGLIPFLDRALGGRS
jgi:hypothetical protein